MTLVVRGAAALAAVAILTLPAVAQPVFSTRVGVGFTEPLFATPAPGNPSTLYVVQRNGQIRTLDTTNGQIGSTPFLNLPAISGTNLVTGDDEQGLLGLAFHPNLPNNGLFYVDYTTTNGAGRVEEYHVVNGTVDPTSRRTIIQVDHPNNTNHNAGWIGFNPLNGTTGPNSGHLYIMTGDGGGANDTLNNAQNTNVLLGKMLRLDINSSSGGNNYSIPTGNMTGTGVRPELFSYGLRKPFRGSFDRTTGNLYIGDVGQRTREEIDFIANGSSSGQNFGWRLREGTIATPNVGGNRPPGNVDPIFDYDHAEGQITGQAVIGGYVYRGPNASLNGTYFFADEVASKIFSFRFDGTNVTDVQERTAELLNAAGGGTISNPSSFAEDGFGNLYVIDYTGGEVFQINPVPEPGSIGLVAAFGLAGWLVGRRQKWLRPVG